MSPSLAILVAIIPSLRIRSLISNTKFVFTTHDPSLSSVSYASVKVQFDIKFSLKMVKRRLTGTRYGIT